MIHPTRLPPAQRSCKLPLLYDNLFHFWFWNHVVCKFASMFRQHCKSQHLNFKTEIFIDRDRFGEDWGHGKHYIYTCFFFLFRLVSVLSLIKSKPIRLHVNSNYFLFIFLSCKTSLVPKTKSCLSWKNELVYTTAALSINANLILCNLQV